MSNSDRTIEEGLVVVAAFLIELGIYFYPATPFDNLVASRGVYNISGFDTSKKEEVIRSTLFIYQSP
jgi:hypothetical protein